ncbi:MAG: RIP metalloprotease RseP [Saprospiraceae bacterium]
MQILVMIGQLILSLSILVVLHEFGHFLPARWFGCRVEKFYLFFDPYFSLFKKKIGDTEWGIGWLPLGGYVKISGMVDESMDMEALAEEPKEWEFRSKPAWQRLIIMLGGVTVNFILGFLIFAGMLWYWGTERLPTENAIYGIYAEELGEQHGLRTGDHVLAIDTVQLKDFGDRYVKEEILFSAARTITIRRDGQEMKIQLPDSLQRNLTKEAYKSKRLYSLPRLAVVDSIKKDTPAESSDLQKGDRVLAVNDVPVKWLQDMSKEFLKYKGETVRLTLDRSGRTISAPVTLTEEGQIGFWTFDDKYYDFVQQDYSISEAIPKGIDQGLTALANQGRAVKQMFNKNIDASDSIGSFITIGRAFGGVWSWPRFWQLTGLLSLILAVMNLLPIPALDGGHVMFLLYEVITGRTPSDKFLQVATTVGFVLVLSLMAFAIFNDVSKLF